MVPSNEIMLSIAAGGSCDDLVIDPSKSHRSS
jgi:hypothetical protein